MATVRISATGNNLDGAVIENMATDETLKELIGAIGDLKDKIKSGTKEPKSSKSVDDRIGKMSDQAEEAQRSTGFFSKSLQAAGKLIDFGFSKPVKALGATATVTSTPTSAAASTARPRPNRGSAGPRPSC